MCSIIIFKYKHNIFFNIGMIIGTIYILDLKLIIKR